MIRIRYFILLAIIFFLSGCVTTEHKSAFNTEKTSKSKQIETRVKIGLQYLELGQSEKALSVLKKANKMDSSNSQLNEALGLVFQRTNEYELADFHFNKAIKADPKYTRARNNYAVFLHNIKKYQKACNQLIFVTQDVFYEKRSDAFSNLGLCYLQLNNPTKAKTAFEKSLQLNPKNARSLLELSHLSFGVKDYSGAKLNLKAFHTVVPKGVASSLLLGYKIAVLFNQDVEAKIYKNALKKLYPTSKEAIML